MAAKMQGLQLSKAATKRRLSTDEKVLLSLEEIRLENGYKEGWLYHRALERDQVEVLNRLILAGIIVRDRNSYSAVHAMKSNKKRSSQVELAFNRRVKKELAPGRALDFPNIEVLPKAVHFQNIRNLISASDWQRLRRATFWAAHYCCQSCGESRILSGGLGFHCHEVWHYNDTTRVQSLKELQCLCKVCHDIKHIDFVGETVENILFSAVGQKFQELSKLSKGDAAEYITRHIELAEHRDRPEDGVQYWTLDVGVLKRVGIMPRDEALEYGVDIPALEEKRQAKRLLRNADKAQVFANVDFEKQKNSASVLQPQQDGEGQQKKDNKLLFTVVLAALILALRIVSVLWSEG